MKRSLALQPLSREHHAALKLAKLCVNAARSSDPLKLSDACSSVAEKFQRDLEPHFKVEECAFLPLLDKTGHQLLLERTLIEHGQLRALGMSLQQRCEASVLDQFGVLLANHVRFEERELFPALEELL